MKDLYIFNKDGVMEVYSEEELGLNGSEEWEEIEMVGEVIKRYRIFDGVGRLEFDDKIYSEEDVMEEWRRIDFEV